MSNPSQALGTFILGSKMSKGAVWCGCAGGGYMVWKGYELATWHRAQSALVTQPGPERLVSSVEAMREPCEVLVGKDVVVRYHHYKNDDRPPSDAHVPKPGPLGRFLSLFNVVKQDEPGPKGEWYEAKGPVDDPARYRRIHGDTEEVTPRAKTGLPWPAGTTRYATLTIEPSPGTKRRGLQGMLDASTDQSLVRCRDSHRHQVRASDGLQGCQQDTSTILAPYLRTMLVPFCLFPFPSSGGLRICQLGGGGGALPAFVYQYFGAFISRLDVVEVEPSVVLGAVAGLGFEHTGTTSTHRGGCPNVITDDGKAFLERTVEACGSGSSMGHDNPYCTYDVLLVDMFDGAQLPPYMQWDPTAFFRLCKSALSDRGVVAINLPRRDA